MTVEVISGFAGVGGFDLAFERAGAKIVAQIEKDKHAASVLKYHWPDVPLFDDVRSVGSHNLPHADVVCGGFPCQDLSQAGQRAGLEGSRSGLFFQLTRIVDELQPAFLLWENVPGLLSSKRGRDFAVILQEMDRIGYSGCWTSLDAQFFGVAQRRRRVFGLFARPDIGAEPCTQILRLCERSRRDAPTGKEARQEVAGTLGDGSKGGHSLDRNAYVVDTLTAPDERGGRSDKRVISVTVTSRVGKGGFTDPENDGIFAFESRVARNGRGAPSDVVPPLKAQSGETGKGDGAPLVAGPTLLPRRLTPLECERLQGFPDGWTEYAGGKWQSDSQRYKQIGNAVAVPVVEWIAKRLVAYLEGAVE